MAELDQERPLWKRREELFGHAEIKEVSGADNRLLQQRHRNPPQLLLGTEEELHRRHDWVLGCIESTLQLEDLGPWRWQRPFFLRLVRRFFDESSNWAAWVAVTPLSVPQERRIVRGNVVEQAGEALQTYRESELRSAKMSLGFGLGEVETESLLLGYQGEFRGDHPYLLRQSRRRRVSSSGGFSRDSLMYFGHPGADQERIKRAHVPAMKQYYDPAEKLLTTASVTFVKLGADEEDDATQLIVTMQPEDAWTVAITPGQRSLYTLLTQYPVDEGMLNDAVRR